MRLFKRCSKCGLRELEEHKAGDRDNFPIAVTFDDWLSMPRVARTHLA